MLENVVSPSTEETPRSKRVFQTPLASRLWALREKVQASMETPLNWDDIESEVDKRRGERTDGE
jgi:hypothetical protein